MIDEADTHNHSCPECGRDWQHWNGICDYVTSYQIHCPEDFFGKSHESLSASTNRPGLLARLGNHRRISLAAFPVGAAILAMGLFTSLYPSSPLREWSVIFLLLGISIAVYGVVKCQWLIRPLSLSAILAGIIMLALMVLAIVPSGPAFLTREGGAILMFLGAFLVLLGGCGFINSGSKRRLDAAREAANSAIESAARDREYFRWNTQFRARTGRAPDWNEDTEFNREYLDGAATREKARDVEASAARDQEFDIWMEQSRERTGRIPTWEQGKQFLIGYFDGLAAEARLRPPSQYGYQRRCRICHSRFTVVLENEPLPVHGDSSSQSCVGSGLVMGEYRFLT